MAKEQTAAFVYAGIAALLLLCLVNMPYWFYSLVRFAAAAAFCYLAFKSYNSDNTDRMILFIILAILFQPIFRIPLGRVVWNIVDVVVAALLLYLLYKHVKNAK